MTSLPAFDEALQVKVVGGEICGGWQRRWRASRRRDLCEGARLVGAMAGAGAQTGGDPS
jgi:hypothetical protein